MNLYTIIACIGSLVISLSWPVASRGSWAFDTASCSDHDKSFLWPQMLRATTIGKNAASWLPRVPALERNKPNFAKTLLGKYADNARAIFNGGSLAGGQFAKGTRATGIASLTAETTWTSGKSPGNLVNDFSPTWSTSRALVLRITWPENADSSRSSYTAMLEI